MVKLISDENIKTLISLKKSCILLIDFLYSAVLWKKGSDIWNTTILKRLQKLLV